MQYDNNNSGALFKNNKEGNESRPDYRGSAEVEHVQFWVSAWIKEGKKDGKKFMSLRFEAKNNLKNTDASLPSLKPDFDDDIPF